MSCPPNQSPRRYGPASGPRGGAKTFQRGKNIGHDIERPERPQRLGVGFIDHRRDGALFEGRADIIMAVRARSLDCEKKVAFLERARVDGNSRGAAARHRAAYPCRERTNETETRP